MVLLAILMQETTVLLSPANTNTQCEIIKMIGSRSENNLRLAEQKLTIRVQSTDSKRQFYNTFTLIFQMY